MTFQLYPGQFIDGLCARNGQRLCYCISDSDIPKRTAIVPGVRLTRHRLFIEHAAQRTTHKAYSNCLYSLVSFLKILSAISSSMYSTGNSLSPLPVRLSARVAPEIQDRILDNLHDSKKDLSICSIVCKSWLSTCRFHLFAEVIYNEEFARFLDSSTHALNSVGPYIKQITMKGPFSQNDRTYISAHSILRLKGVVKLHIQTFNWESVEALTYPTSFLFLIPGSVLSRHLTSLTLRFIKFPSFTVLAALLDALHVLQELLIFDVTWGAHRGDASNQSTLLKQSTLKKLSIEHCDNQGLLNWLRYGVISDASIRSLDDGEQPHRSFPHLIALTIHDILPGQGDMLSGFMAVLGESLEHLEVGFSPYNDNGNFNESRAIIPVQ